MRSILLLVLGVPIPIVILIAYSATSSCVLAPSDFQCLAFRIMRGALRPFAPAVSLDRTSAVTGRCAVRD
jgi:hypothetical protein